MFGLVVGFALLASAISTNKLILTSLSPTFFVALRMLASGLILVSISMFSPRMRISYLKSDVRKLLLISTLTTWVPSIFKAYALKHLPSAKAAFLGSLDPFVTALYAYLLWNETLTRNKIIGILIGFSGTLIILMTTSPSEEFLKVWWLFSLPELVMLAAVAFQRFGWIKAQELLKADRYKPTELNGMMYLIGGIYALCTSYFMNECDFCSIPFNTHFIFLFVYTVFVGNIIANTIYAYYLKSYSATFVSLASLSVPLFVQLYAPVLLGESVSLIFFIALAIVFVGLYIFSYDEGKKKTL